MAKSVVEDIKYDEGQTNLTEKQIQDIANEALHEAKNPEKADDWKNPVDEEVVDKDAGDKANEQDADATAKKEAEQKSQQELDAKAQADAKLKADQEAADAKAKSDAAAKSGKVEDKDQKSDKQFQIPAETRAKLVEELALKESLTLEEAEAQIAKDEATVNKYKNDPVELARALRHTQREGDKAKAELDAVKKAGNNPPAPVLNNVKDYVQHQLEPIKDKVIESYKKEYPELVEGQTDEFIFGLIKKEAIDRTVKVLEENQAKLSSAAKEKRANLIMDLSDQDKSFLPDIKAIIERTNDRQIMAKDYDIKDVIYWAKGKQVDRLVKEAEERGFKRGQEQPQIIGEKLPGGGKPQGGGVKAPKITLSDVQKERALNMFDSVPSMTDQDKFDAYVETYPEEFKK